MLLLQGFALNQDMRTNLLQLDYTKRPVIFCGLDKTERKRLPNALLFKLLA
jgi:hypothetical protein